ncbi:hypothetical protein [Streptomyces sp. NBC_01264]|uniref:hypothetical protein n=1 Tax=Streptomyces sp. NBC_01264 TaxID=2903804 RepID=UPI00225842F0|nr:hypothetical protein [Streptomyces sp. NBC_01264]MCX4780050.1 hypothetical protein [Streptomyces sp. NBC_01264]
MSASCSCGVAAVVQWRQRADEKTTDTVPVFACPDHALSPEAAAYVHEAKCPGPGKNRGCTCPVPSVVEFPFEVPADDPRRPPARRLPPGW